MLSQVVRVDSHRTGSSARCRPWPSSVAYGAITATGCASCPTGFVTDKSDCNDNPALGGASVHPGQIDYFPTANAVVGFDYDCSGNNEIENNGIVVGINCGPGNCPGNCFAIGGGPGDVSSVGCGGIYSNTIGCGGVAGASCNINPNPACQAVTGTAACVDYSNPNNTCPLVARFRLQCH
jgi:hypothetical protein